MTKIKDDKQYTKMTETSIGKLIVSLSIPTIITMLTTAIYNMADTYFVSHLGKSATGAVGVVFSLMAIIQAIGFTVGMGSGSLISRLLGEQNREKANIIASSGIAMSLIFGFVLTIVGITKIDWLVKCLGSTVTIFPFAKDYAKYILYGAPIMCASFLLNNILRSEGKALFSMLGIATGGILNIVLDPIFIFKFDLGISGAAIATLTSQTISFCILALWFLLKKTSVTISIRLISRDITDYVNILKTGLPSFSRQGLASIATMALNNMASPYGDEPLAAMSVVTKVFMFINSVMIGFGQGYQPVVGYNYGAKRYDRVREAFNFAIKTSMVFMTIFGIVGFIFAPQIVTFFQPDSRVVELGTLAFQAQCAFMWVQPIIALSNMTFQAIGKSWQATFVSSCRQGIYFLPLILILPHIFKLNGIIFTQTIADILTAITAVFFIIPFIRDLKKLQ